MTGTSKQQVGMQELGSLTTARRAWLIVAALAALFAFTSIALASHAGQFDRSFNHGGVATSRPAGHRGVAWAVALGKKDKPVVAGSSGAASAGFGVVRYTRKGAVDSSFGSNGVQTIFSATGNAAAYSVDVAKQGAVVAAGRSCQGTVCHMAIAKYDSSGQPDQGFGNDGRVELSFATDDSVATGVKFTPDDKILVVGSRCVTTKDCGFALARLLPNGDTDPQFGPNGNGEVVTSFENKSGDPITAGADGMAIDSRGRIAVGGYSSFKRGTLALYKPNGRLVRSFGHDGKVVPKLHHLGGIEGLAVDAKDKIVVAGEDKKPGERWTVARFGKQGGVDPSFGNEGEVTTGFQQDGQVTPSGVAIDSKNRIVVAGIPWLSLARYQPNGHLNKSFGDHGRFTQKHIGAGFGGVAIDSHDRPVVPGAFDRGRFAVSRFLG
jgi:uncharacterized delta-60 repeat protein